MKFSLKILTQLIVLINIKKTICEFLNVITNNYCIVTSSLKKIRFINYYCIVKTSNRKNKLNF